uniref:HTH lysR-type domain-containing protein n=1 Tax=Acyrthosiphon pisum TaxID=7029 RepID=A0A8R2BAW8_ACYPI|eukprot:XP_008189085.1 PREDICTED: HTH-type transcriptional regulator PtxR-like [Acyrthosiphon pisum]
MYTQRSTGRTIRDAMLTDLNDLFFFASVVDHQGFAPAGRALGIPKSKLSRRVALLEERLGVRLIQRSTRRFSVTELGQTYYAHCKAMLVEAEAAQQAIEQTRAEPCGTVRMSCPVAILHTRVGSMVAAFMADYPKVTVHLEATNRRVDVVGEGLDLAIRVRPPPLDDSDLGPASAPTLSPPGQEAEHQPEQAQHNGAGQQQRQDQTAAQQHAESDADQHRQRH